MEIYKKWFITVLSGLLASFLVIVGVNYFIDPYNVFKTPTIERVNVNKIETKEYLMKTREIALNKPDVIFLGSSRTEVGLDPEYYFQVTGDTAYNLGISGANIYEQLRYFEYALLNNSELKRVVLGVDFAGFNTNNKNINVFDEERLNTVYFIKSDLLENLFTKQAFKDSVKVLLDNISQKQVYTNNNFLQDGRKNEVLLIQKHQEMLRQGQNIFFNHLKMHLKDKEVYGDYELSQEKINDFQKIVSICQEKEIDLIVFIHPAHALQWEGVQEAELWEEFEQWKRELVKITPIWDFSGFNSVTTTPPYNFEHYLDQSHYRKQIGNLVLNRMLHVNEASVPEDFGVYLTNENLEDHLLRIEKDRETWEENNPEILQKINELTLEN